MTKGEQLMKKVCVIVNSRANYGRIKSVLFAIEEHPKLDLQLIVGASALLYRFGNVIDQIKLDGFKPKTILYSIVEGGTLTTMCKSTGIAILELSTQMENLKPDIALTVADRFETIATAITASYMNIPLAHTQGGEVTGSIDESVRHAITKLSHIHFPATEKAKENIIRMGEDPKAVFLTGCPSIDILNSIDLSLSDDIFDGNKGAGPLLDPHKPYLVVLQHPVTTEYGHGFDQIEETLKAITSIQMPTIWLWPNVDAGSDDVSKRLRMYREKEKNQYIRFFRNFSVENYDRIIANSKCLIGNSSSGIREGSFVGVPTVNIGTRQMGRECGENVIHAGYDWQNILNAIQFQIQHGKYEKNTLYGDGNAGKRIAEILANNEINVHKRLMY